MNSAIHTAPKIKEVLYGSLSACKDIDIGQSVIIKPDENNANQWTEIPMDHHNAGSGTTCTTNNVFQANAIIHSIVPFAAMKQGATIRIPPMQWHCGGWDDQHFHDQLRIPLPVRSGSSSSSSTPMSSSSSSPSRGIVVTLEAMARECIAVALSPRPYFDLGKTYVVHLGAASNLQTVIRRRMANPSDTVDIVLPSPNICSSDKFQSYWIMLQNKGQVSVGVGKIPGKHCVASLDDSVYHELRSGVDAVKYVGLGNSALGKRARDVKVRNVRVMSVPDAFVAFGGIPVTAYDAVQARQEEQQEEEGQRKEDYENDGIEDALWMEYSKECEKAKKRAAKFGIEYKQPQPDAFFSWSEARRMRANPERGFITGFDIMDEKEQEKQRKRKERFEMDSNKSGIGDGDDQGNDNGNDDEEDNDDDDLVEQNVNKKAPLIPIHEAWDNEELVGSMRVDPPESLWNKSDDWMEDNDDDDGGGGDDDDNVRYVPTKIHLFAIDWAAFKQIRSDDLLSYFKLYGPSYVEWLGELSCNIHFEDRFSASRALEALSRALPNEIPEKVVEEEEGEKKAISNTNLGLMGWRLCNHFIYKIRSDKFGKRGTRSRCIVRMATSLDVLEERPSTFPKPPPGYTTHRVLGPGSDFHKTYPRHDHGSGNRYDRRRRVRVEKRRRRHRSVSDDGMNHHHVEDDEFDQSAIDRALTAPRR